MSFIFFLLSTQNTDSTSVKLIFPIPQKITINRIKNRFTTDLIDAFKNAFRIYSFYCFGKDEINPDTHECSNQYGVSSSVFESLESAELFGLRNIIRKAKNFIKNLNLSDLGWINRHEFWTRDIASLIGAYIISNNSFYIQKAVDFSVQMINLERLSPNRQTFVNFKTKSMHQFSLLPGTPLSAFSNGLPELISLSKLIDKNRFPTKINYSELINERIEELILHIPKSNSDGSIPIFYHVKSQSPASSDISFDYYQSHSLLFYHNIAISHLLQQRQIFEVILENASKKITKLEELFTKKDSNVDQLFLCLPLIDAISQMALYNESLFSPPYSHFIISKIVLLQPFNDFFEIKKPFHFEGTLLKILARHSYKRKDYSLIQQFYKNVHEKCKAKNGKGFVGFQLSSKDKLKKDSIQNSRFFGDWMFTGGIFGNHLELIQYGIFNERGHILGFVKK